MKRRGVLGGVIAGMALGLATASGCASSSLATETGMPAILVVDGHVAGGNPVRFDLDRLKSLPAITVKTVTPWTDGENTFEGVRVRDLLDRLGGKGSAVLVDSIDDYQIAIPMADFRDYDVIVAYAMNGQPLPLDDKGPLWIIYPFSAHFGLQKDIYFSRSVWQLTRLTVQ